MSSAGESKQLGKRDGETITAANAGKRKQKFWKNSKTLGFFHFLWGHLLMYVIRDAEVVVLVQHLDAVLNSC